MAKAKDGFSGIAPEKRIVTLVDRNGKVHKVDAGWMTLGIQTHFLRNRELIAAAFEHPMEITPEEADAFNEFVAAVCEASDDDLTKDFIETQVHSDYVNEVAREIFKTLIERGQKLLGGVAGGRKATDG